MSRASTVFFASWTLTAILAFSLAFPEVLEHVLCEAAGFQYEVDALLRESSEVFTLFSST